MKNNLKDILIQETNSVSIKQSKKLKDTPIETQAPAFEQEKIANSQHSNTHYKLRLKAILSCLCLLIVAITASIGIFKSTQKEASAITSYIIETQTNICVTTDKDNSVIGSYSLNNDGDSLLASLPAENLEGKPFDDFIEKFIDISIDKGFINNENPPAERYINFKVSNNKKSFAIKKAKHAKEIFEEKLKNKGFTNYSLNSEFMPVKDFKQEMGFEFKTENLDEMRDHFKNRRRFFNPNFLPPPPA